MMDFNKLHERPGLARKEFEQIEENILALAQFETKHYTWEEKIDNLARLAKEIGVYLDVEREEPGSDYCRDVRRRLTEAYEEFCQWRHDETWIVDEMRYEHCWHIPPSRTVREHIDAISTMERTSGGVLLWRHVEERRKLMQEYPQPLSEEVQRRVRVLRSTEQLRKVLNGETEAVLATCTQEERLRIWQMVEHLSQRGETGER